MTAGRERRAESIASPGHLDREVAAAVETIAGVLDSARVHEGQRVPACRAVHPRLVSPHPPVHGSGMGRVARRFSIPRRERLRLAEFADEAASAGRLRAFVAAWDRVAHRFERGPESVAKVRARCARTEVPPERGRVGAA